MKKRLAFELRRKFIHLLTLLFLVMYIVIRHYYDHPKGLMALIGVVMAFLILEYFRIVKKMRIPIFHVLWREKEKDRLGGNVYIMIGAVVAFAAFDFQIAVVVMLMTIFGDMAGALIGIPFGKHKIRNQKNKSWEGTIGEFFVNMIIGLLLLDSVLVVFGMALMATYVETKFSHVDDNLSIPIFAGFVGQVLSFI